MFIDSIASEIELLAGFDKESASNVLTNEEFARFIHKKFGHLMQENPYVKKMHTKLILGSAAGGAGLGIAGTSLYHRSKKNAYKK